MASRAVVSPAATARHTSGAIDGVADTAAPDAFEGAIIPPRWRKSVRGARGIGIVPTPRSDRYHDLQEEPREC